MNGLASAAAFLLHLCLSLGVGADLATALLAGAAGLFVTRRVFALASDARFARAGR
jgi:ABC-type nickel/cobalt efflux system permease component RcnA